MNTVDIEELLIDDIITCTLYGTGSINAFNNATILGFVSGKNLAFPSIAATEHANRYSSIPNNNTIPNNYRNYNYILLKTNDGNKYEIGLPWINKTSLTRSTRKTLTLVIRDFNPELENNLLLALDKLGLSNRTLTYL